MMSWNDNDDVINNLVFAVLLLKGTSNCFVRANV